MEFSLNITAAAYATADDIATALLDAAHLAAARLRKPGPFHIDERVDVTPDGAARSIQDVSLIRHC